MASNVRRSGRGRRWAARSRGVAREQKNEVFDGNLESLLCELAYEV